ARCCEAEGHMWRQAQKIWESLLKEPEAVPGGRAQILYSLGQCMRNNDPANSQTALNYWREVIALGGEEGQAAGLRLGAAQLANDIDTALKSWSDALSQVQKPADYHNAYISLDHAREIVENAWPRVMDKDYQAASRLADLYERLVQTPKAELY